MRDLKCSIMGRGGEQVCVKEEERQHPKDTTGGISCDSVDRKTSSEVVDFLNALKVILMRSKSEYQPFCHIVFSL